MTQAPQNCRFGPEGRFQLQPLERRLLVDGAPAAIGARAFDLLLELASRPGQLRSKHELIEAVWPGVVVEEGNLATQISTLRKVLGGEVIVTIPGRGYRFAAPTGSGRTVPEAPAAMAPDTAVAIAGTSPEAARLETNLPATLPPLVGRGDDLAALHELVAQHRLVSIVGAGGIGKTTVAQHLTAQRRALYRHGVCWVELATVTDPDALPAAIAAAIDVRTGSGDALSGLCRALRPLAMLVVLDNAEQVVDGVARVAQALLDQAPGVRLVVTSQLPLKLPAERAYRIGALAVPQGALPAAQALEFGAIALFVERAQAADARFAFNDGNAAAVIELCHQLDGVALAIELAAARAPMLGVQRLAASMGDRLKVLTHSRNRLAPARQQTLRAALEWSHGFLDATEQAVFRRLSVFVGSAALAMVQLALADPPGEGELDEWAVLDALTLLVDRSLVVAMPTEDGSEPRFRLLESARLFAREKLQQAGEEDALRQRHALAVAARFHAASDEFESGEVPLMAWRRAMEADIGNGREALGWLRAADDAVRAVQVAVGLVRSLWRGDFRELVRICDAIEPLVDRIDEAVLLGRLATMWVSAVSHVDPRRTLLRLRQLDERLQARVRGDVAQLRWARHRAASACATVLARSGDLQRAEVALARARDLVDPAWPAVRGVPFAQAASTFAQMTGDAQAQLTSARHELALQEQSGASTSIALANLIDAELAAGNPAQAVTIGLALVHSLVDGRNERALVIARMNLSAALLCLDRPADAEPHLRAGWAQAQLFEHQATFADFLSLFCALNGRMAPAARLVGYADATNVALGARQPNEADAVARAAGLAREALGDEAFDRLHAEGALLNAADITPLAFAPA